MGNFTSSSTELKSTKKTNKENICESIFFLRWRFSYGSFTFILFDKSTSTLFVASVPMSVFLHIFLEIWYSWRDHMIAFATGFRTIAPDYRGYGLSDSPADPSKASFSDLLGILGSLNIPKLVLETFTEGTHYLGLPMMY